MRTARTAPARALIHKPFAPLSRFKRRIVQLLAALLFNLNLTGFLTGTIYKGGTKAICAPGFNCYSCPGAIASCPIGSLQVALEGLDRKLPFYLVGTLLAFGALFGRTICGWLCPFGLIQEALDKIPLPKIAKGMWSRALSKLKYVVLVVAVLILPVILMSPTFCAWICPAGTLEAGLPLIALNENLRDTLGWQFVWKLTILVVFLIACLVIYRPFCRFLCPLGALLSFFNRIALLRYHVHERSCTHCGACMHSCKMDTKKVSDAECIQCGCCKNGCAQGAISFTLTDLRGTLRRHHSPAHGGLFTDTGQD